MVRALPCHGRGCGFEPRRLRGGTGIALVLLIVIVCFNGHIRRRQTWKQPLLRMVDTIVGIAVGVVGASIDLRTARQGASRHLKDTALCKVWM